MIRQTPDDDHPFGQSFVDVRSGADGSLFVRGFRNRIRMAVELCSQGRTPDELR